MVNHRMRAVAAWAAVPLSFAAAWMGSAALFPDAPASGKARLYGLQPWDGGHPAGGVTVSGTVSGTCPRPSLTTGRPDAYRCYTQDGAVDPCFTSLMAHVGDVLCPADGSVTSFVRLSPEVLPDREETSWERPVFVVFLANGQTCWSVGEHGAATRYLCPAGTVSGPVQDRNGQRVASYHPQGTGRSQDVEVTREYR